MIIYNVTTKVDGSIQNNWVEWAKNEHIPEIIATGCFSSATLAQLLETDDTDGPTYTIQYHAESKALYNLYIEKFAVTMRQKAFDKWGNQFIAFRSLMQVVH
jgi:hydroxyethylthiazole kinase-like sugar kinase family protein